MPTPDRLLKRLRKKAKRGMRGWPVATIAFYGPDLTRPPKWPSASFHPRTLSQARCGTGKSKPATCATI